MIVFHLLLLCILFLTSAGIFCFCIKYLIIFPLVAQQYLQFLSPPNYNVFTDVDDSNVAVALPTTLQFGGSYYSIAYVRPLIIKLK